MKGRKTLGCYKKMEIFDCVADSPEAYVEKAIRLGNDAPYRTDLRARIQTASTVLYEDGSIIDEFDRFFRTALEQAP